jgi:ferric-dicitrate binding protein FerR (iron transport regulator)
MTTEQKLGPPPVERLSDVAWARVERNVFQRMTEGTVTHAAAARDVTIERKNQWLWLAVPGAAAAAFALAFFSMNGPTGSTSNEEPSRVVAGASPSSVSFGDAHVTLDANSAVVMDQKAGKPTALLEHGAAVFGVAPRGDRGPFTVLAGDALVRTTHAQFRVTREGELARVTVDDGSVEIRFRGHDLKVAAQHAWSSERPSEITDLSIKR